MDAGEELGRIERREQVLERRDHGVTIASAAARVSGLALARHGRPGGGSLARETRRMDHDRPAAPDALRDELLAAAAALLPRLAPGLPAEAAALVAPLFAALPTAELAAEPAEALAEAAASVFSLALDRPAGTARVRVAPFRRGVHPVAEIVTDDMPFLVDSALAALSLSGRGVRRLLHPILPVRRDPAGRFLGFGGEGAAPESLMRIETGPPVGRLPGMRPAEGEAALAAALTRAMADTRTAVLAFPSLVERLRAAGREAAADADAAAFLAWMAEDNFVLLGHRRLDAAADGRLVPSEQLGLLADPAIPVFDALRDLSAVPDALRAAAPEAPGLMVLKANMRATVHRPQHADAVITRIPGGGVRIFLGLFAASAYNRNPRSIPWLGAKVERILALAGVPPESHDGRAFRNILDTWPRDELFQAEDHEILRGARIALDLSLRPRAALSVRADRFGRFVSILAWLPRETFDTAMRERIGTLLARAFGGRLSAWYIALGDSALARVHYIIGTVPGMAATVDHAALEAAVAEAARGFADRLAEALSAARGEAEAARLLATWGEAFPPAYRQQEPIGQTLADLALVEGLQPGERPRVMLHLPAGAGPRMVALRLASPGQALALADALPLFESLDLRAIEEVPHHLHPAGGAPVVLHAYRLEARADVAERHLPLLADALGALLSGAAEADGFNRLVLRAGLSWRECWLLRALFRWLKQVGFPFAQESVEAALAAHPEAASLLVAIFHARFDPDAPSRDDPNAPSRADPGALSRDETRIEEAWAMLVENLTSPDAERILLRLRTALDAMLRTNYFQGKDYLSFKLDSAAAGEMPQPRPWREIFVHSPRMEGCHLRAGAIARGGIRWSDRREDFRTEILGLMKAQRLKNVIIVPTGAKGGFVLKGALAEGREALQEAGIAAYRTLIRGMLDLTDNLHGDAVVLPVRVRRRDGDDPYIVAAADKGTASFSDIANALAAEYGFWLGDAFASGGSAGYDHKRMGITARGAWVMIARHFAEQGRGIHDAPFTVAGIGDMSGDVFGNGLLVSRRTRLVAAFDHRHIFLDPDPDTDASFAERQRLFALPRSSWADYDARLISAGGGVFPRSARSIPLSPQARALLGIAAERATPAEVMRAILTAPVDLLYFGGIGTYVKSSTESHADAGDRANDAIRVDGRELRAKVVGEGANLALTQAGRIEAARGGVRLDTDALDNSAGVSTSDHEVNIKILLSGEVAAGRLTLPQRDTLLAGMTDEVAALVLADNHAQHLAVSLEQAQGAAALPAQAALVARLEQAGLLDRAVAGLPDAPTLAGRAAAGDALTRPEIAALLPFLKLWLTDALLDSALPEEPALAPLLVAYFPTPLRERFADGIARHRLRRDLVAMSLANRIANRIGCAGFARLAAEGDAVAAVRAAWLAGELLGLDSPFAAADEAIVPPDIRREALSGLARLQEAAARDLLSEARPLDQALEALRPGIAALRAIELARAVPGRLAEAGVSDYAARLVAAAGPLAAAPSIVRLAQRAGAEPVAAARAWAEAGERFGLEALRGAVGAASAPGPFGPRARAALLDDVSARQADLAVALLAGAPVAAAEAAAPLVREAAMAADLAAATVALRALARAA
jgi:glutamate dehydrogenase